MSEAVQEFRALLTHRFGWRLDNDHGEIERVLIDRRGPRRSHAEYLASIAALPGDAAEIRAIAEALAVSETYFFRNPEQFAVLAELALPAAASRAAGSLRILSAGAASGEEAYSIAMAVLQFRKRHALPPTEIVGVDISRRAIERARRGSYTPWALRAVPASLTEEFFVPEGRHFRVRPDVAAMVRFHEANLLELATVAPGPWDIVFFRNTFMYFTPDVARRVFEQVAAMMPPAAFLFLGHAESLRGISDAFALRHTHHTFYYQREPAGAPSLSVPQAIPLPVASAVETAPVIADDDAWFHEIARASARIASLVDGRVDDAAAAEPGRLRPAPPLSVALGLLAQDRHDAALAAVGDGHEPERLLLRSVLLVNMGRLADARAAANRVLAADGMQAGAHYVLALCAERGRDAAAAVRHDDLAIQLDDTFAMPHLHLAMLARRRGDADTARRHAGRARDLFAAEDDLRILVFGGGFSRLALMRLCDAQLGSRAS